MATSSTEAPSVHGRPGFVQVEVNHQPVELPDRDVTGLAIKELAIDQGVDIQSNFSLSVKRGEHYVPVTDTDEIRPRKGEEFLAVTPDDNS